MFTVGHSTRQLSELVEMLKQNGVALLADVRTVPRSRTNPQFNTEALAQQLPAVHGLAYCWLGRELGGLRKADKSSQLNAGWDNASFRGKLVVPACRRHYMQTQEFQTGVEHLCQLATQQGPAAIMCAEAVNWRCHRSLISDALTVRGWQVVHIITAGKPPSPHKLTKFASVDGLTITYPAYPHTPRGKAAPRHRKRGRPDSGGEGQAKSANAGDMLRQAGHQAVGDTPPAALEARETPTERQGPCYGEGVSGAAIVGIDEPGVGLRGNSRSLEGKLVCGDDGITYQNACLAHAQGVKVVQEKPCSGRTKSADPASFVATAKIDTNGRARSADLARFQGEGFKMVAKVHLVDTPLPHPKVAPGSVRSRRPPKGSVRSFATRITPLGYLYVKPTEETVALAAGGQAEIPPFTPTPPNNTAHNSRKLLIWGTDDRVQVLSRAYPFSAVGNIRGEEASGISYGCSGAVVAASTIFTAGHWYPWAYATTFWNNAYVYGLCDADGKCDHDSFKYDIAVIRVDQPIGQYVGSLGMKWESTWQGYSVTSGGYPGDKAFGTMWKTSGKLDAFSGADSGIDDGWNGVVSSDLDAAPGQSGSNVWDSGNRVRALVNSGGDDGRTHHRTVTRSVANFVVGESKGLNLFNALNYAGPGITLRPGNYPQMPAGRNNWARSASISPGCTATLYDDPGYLGKQFVITANNFDFGDFANRASSVKLVCS
ncbi:hypothetical protein N2152v2_003370 [Parachlorella kessleri]